MMTQKRLVVRRSERLVVFSVDVLSVGFGGSLVVGVLGVGDEKISLYM